MLGRGSCFGVVIDRYFGIFAEVADSRLVIGYKMSGLAFQGLRGYDHHDSHWTDKTCHVYVILLLVRLKHHCRKGAGGKAVMNI